MHRLPTDIRGWEQRCFNYCLELFIFRLSAWGFRTGCWVQPGLLSIREFQVPVSYAGILSMIISLGTIVLQPAERPAYPEAGNGKGDGRQRRDHCRGPLWFFCQFLFLDALPVGHSLRSGSRKRGRLAEQLCSAPLRKPAYELAPLHVGRWRRRRTVYHGICPDQRHELERRLQDRCGSPAPSDPDSGLQPASVEKETTDRGERGKGGGSQDPFPERDPPHSRSQRSFYRLFLLLRPGADCRTLGQQLSASVQRSPQRDRRLLCQHVLYRHHGGPGPQRISHYAVSAMCR